MTDYLSPGLTPVMGCACLLFDRAKYIQLMCPHSYGEDKMVIMFGGHLEMTM